MEAVFAFILLAVILAWLFSGNGDQYRSFLADNQVRSSLLPRTCAHCWYNNNHCEFI